MLKYKLASPILMWSIVLSGSIPCLVFFNKTILLSSNFINIVIFIIILIIWIYIFISSLKAHRNAVKSVNKIDKLVITGIYSKLRHPIYIGDIILSWSVFILLPKLNVLLAVIWLNLVLVVWMFVEERTLISKFGKEYGDYKEKTGIFKFW